MSSGAVAATLELGKKGKVEELAVNYGVGDSFGEFCVLGALTEEVVGGRKRRLLKAEAAQLTVT